MNQLLLFFGDDADSILTCMRLRRRLQDTAEKLRARKSILEKQVKDFSVQYGDDAELARKSRSEADERLKEVAHAEAQARKLYARTCTEIAGFWKCLGTSLRSIFENRPGVKGMCGESEHYSKKWRDRREELDALRTVSHAREVKYRKLMDTHESDLFAIRQIDAHLQRIGGQIKTEERTITAIIQYTVRCLSYASLARAGASGLDIDGVAEDIIALKRVFNQLEALRAVHSVRFTERDAGTDAGGWMQQKFLGKRSASEPATAGGWKTIEKALAHGFHEESLPFDCEVPVRGTGTAGRSNGKWSGKSPPPAADTAAIIFSDTLQLKRRLLQNQWDSKRVADTISGSGIKQFAVALGTDLQSRTSSRIKALETRELELMRGITKKLLSSFSN